MSTPEVQTPTQWEEAAAAFGKKLSEFNTKKGDILRRKPHGKRLHRVEDYLLGKDAPRDRSEFNSLMTELGITDSALAKPALEALTALFKVCQQHIAEAPQRSEPATAKPAHGHVEKIGPRRLSVSHRRPPGSCNKPVYTYKIACIHDGETPYAKLDESELNRIVQETQNPGEWLCAVRTLAKAKFSCEGVYFFGFQAYPAENGRELPGRDSLRAMEAICRKYGDRGDFQRFEDLVIHARLKAIAEPGTNHVQKTAELAEMPPRYWRAVLDKFLHQDAGASLSGGQKTDRYAGMWLDMVPDITREGEYCRAVRNYLGLTAESLGKSIGCPSRSLQHFESDLCSMSSRYQIALAQKLKAFFAAKQNETPSDVFYVEGNFDSLGGRHHQHDDHSEGHFAAVEERRSAATPVGSSPAGLS